MADKVREAAERWASSEVDAYPGRTLEDRIKSWMAGGVHPDDVEWFLIDAYEAGYRAALAAPSGGDATPRDEAVAWAREARAVAEAAFDKMTDAERAVLPLNVQEDARRRVSLAHIEAGEDAPAGQGTAVVSVPSKYTRLAWAMVSALNALAAERAAKGGEKEATQGTCSRCGYLAMPPACTKCYSPYPAPAPRDGGDAKGDNEGGPRG